MIIKDQSNTILPGILQYGDIVFLLFEGQSQRDSGQSLTSGVEQFVKTDKIDYGILTSSGQFEKELWLQTIPSEDKMPTYDQLIQNLPRYGITNFREHLFVITPKLQVEFHKEYESMLNLYQTAKSAGNQEALHLYHNKLIQLQDRVVQEQSTNNEIIQNQLGQQVTYGSPIQLRHLESQLYVTCTNDNSDSVKIGYSADLTHWQLRTCAMKVNSKYKSRKVGNVVQYGDEILLENQRKDYFLDFDPFKGHYLNRVLFKKPWNPYQREILTRDHRTNQYRCIFGSRSNTSWRICPFQKFTDSEHSHEDNRCSKSIHGLDYVRLVHSEQNGTLNASLEFKSPNPEVYLRIYNGKDKKEQYDFGGIWQIEHEDKLTGDRFQINQQLASQAVDLDDIVTKSRGIKLKHSLSSRYLHSGELKGEKKHIIILSSLTNDAIKKQYRSLNLEPIIKNTSHIEDERAFYLQTQINDEDFNFNYKRSTHLGYNFIKARRVEFDKDRYVPLQDKDMDELRLLSFFNPGNSYENAFKVEKLCQQEQHNYCYIKGAIPYLMYFNTLFEDQKTQRLKPSTYQKVETFLQKIVCFLFKKERLKTPGEFFNIDGEPDEDRQRMLRSLNFIDILTDLLYLPFSQDLFKLATLQSSMPITRVLSRTYTTVKYIIREQRTNELYCSQWLNLFVVQSLKTKAHNDIKAESTLTELIDNNKRILDTRFNKDTINSFIQLVSGEKESKYLNILNVIIKVDGKPVKKNQREVAKLLFKDVKMRERLLFAIRKEEGEVRVYFDLKNQSKSVTIKELKKQSKYLDIMQSSASRELTVNMYKYLLAITQLMADLCKKRNYQAINSLKQNFPFQIFLDIIIDDSMPSEVREVFINFIINLWLDVSPLKKALVPNLIKFWSTVRDQQMDSHRDMLRMQRAKFYPLVSHNIEYLKQINRRTLNHETNDETIKLILAELSLFSNFVRMDIIDKELVQKAFDSIHDIIECIVKVFTQDKRQSERITEYKRNLLFQIAISSCGILKQLFNYEIDLKSEQVIMDIKHKIQHYDEKKAKAFDQVYGHKHHSNIFDQIFNNRDIESLKTSETQFLMDLDDIISQNVKQNQSWDINNAKSILYLLMNLSMLNNKELTTHSIEMLYLMHSQPTKLRDTLEGMLLIDGQKEGLYHKIRKTQKELEVLSESSEKWLLINKCQEQKQCRYTILELKNFLEGETNITEKPTTQLNEPDQENDMIEPETSTRNKGSNLMNLDYVYLDQVKIKFMKPNRFCQEMYRNVGCLKSVMHILEWDLNFYEYMTNTASVNLITRIIYEVLAWATIDNPETQKYLLKYSTSIFLKHFAQEQDNSRSVAASLLLNYLVEQNDEIFEKLNYFELFLDRFFIQADSLQKKDILKAYTMGMIQKLVENDNPKFKTHQSLVVSRLFSYSNKSGFMFLIDESEIMDWSTQLHKIQTQHKFRNYRLHLVQPELCYFVSNMRLLTQCAAGLNSFVENICQNKFDLKQMLMVLKLKDLHFFIKNEIVQFFYHVYLDTERENFFFYQDILINHNQILLQDFKDILDGQYIPHDKEESQSIILVSHYSANTVEETINNYLVTLILCFDNVVNKNIPISTNSEAFQSFKVLYVTLFEYCRAHKQHPNPQIRLKLFELSKSLRLNAKDELLAEIDSVKMQDLVLKPEDEDLSSMIKASQQNSHRSQMLNGNFSRQNSSRHSRGSVSIPLLVNHANEIKKSKYHQNDFEDKDNNLMDTPAKQKRGSTVPDGNFAKNHNTNTKVGNDSNLKTSIIPRLQFKQIAVASPSPGNSPRARQSKFGISQMEIGGDKQGSNQNQARAIIKQKSQLKTATPAKSKDEIVCEFGLDEAYKVEVLHKSYFSQQQFKERCDSEFSRLVEYVTNIENNQNKQDIQTISFQEFLASLIDYLTPEDQGINSTLEDLVTGLRIFRMYIEVANKEVSNKNIAEWDVDDWSECKDEVIKRQNVLIDLNIVDLLMTLLIEFNKEQVFEEIINLSIALTLGGNIKAQSAFKDGFNKDKNQNRVMQTIKDKLENGFLELRTLYEDLTESVMKNVARGMLDDNLEPLYNNSQQAEILKRIIRFLQLLCEGHNIELQNYLHTQQENTSIGFKNVNFVKDTCFIFGSFVKYINPALGELGVQILDFLIESIQGPCIQNQNSLLDAKIVDYCKDLMMEFGSDADFEIKGFQSDQALINQCLKKSVSLLYSLLEGNQNPKIWSQLKLVNSEFLFRLLREEFRSYVMNLGAKDPYEFPQSIAYYNRLIKTDIFEDEFAVAFDSYFLIKNLKIKAESIKKIGSLNQNEQKRILLENLAFDFFTFHSGSIEIVFSQKLFQVYFIIQPSVRLLDKDTKDFHEESLDLTSGQKKVVSFLRMSPKLFDLIEHLYKLHARNRLLSPGTFLFLKKVSLGIAFLLNFLILIFFQKKLEFGKPVDDPTYDANHWSIYSLGLIHLSLGVLLFFVFLYVKAPIIIQENWREYFFQYKTKLQMDKLMKEDDTLDLSFKNRSLSTVGFIQRTQILQQVHKRLKAKNTNSYLENIIMSGLFFFQDYDFKYILTNISLSLGAVLGSYTFFYSLLMLDIINHFVVLKNVVKSIQMNLDQLGLTTLLGMLIIYFFTELGFFYFPEDYYMDSVGNGESTCTSMHHCFLTVLMLAPRSSGSVGDVMSRISYTQKEKYYIRFFYDLSVFITINIILMNLLFGIIIDTFASLRKEKNVIDDHLKMKCSICSQESYKFETNTFGFKYHTGHEHNLWHYFYFMYNLRKKDPTEFTGFEQMVFYMLKDEKTDWMPVGMAMSLNQGHQLSEVDVLFDKILNEAREINQVIDAQKQRKQLEKASQQMQEKNKIEKKGSDAKDKK